MRSPIAHAIPNGGPWTPETTGLWGRIAAHPFECPKDGLDLARRLAREQGWSLDQARRAIGEYRRFCFLCLVAGEPMTPSVAVDEVWHLHLTYTRDYWHRFCPETLGTALHHDPTRGGAAEGRRYLEQYARTLRAYERWFGPAPEDLWPASRARFADPGRIRRVDLNRYRLIPRPRLPRLALPGRPWPAMTTAALAGSMALVLAPLAWAALPANPLDWTAVPFLGLFVLLALAAFLLGRWL